MEAVDFRGVFFFFFLLSNIFILLFCYSLHHPSSKLSDNKLYSWLKFVAIKGTEQKHQEEDTHQGEDAHQGVQGGLVQGEARAAQDVLSGSKWQGHVQSIHPGKPMPVSGSEACMGAGFVGTSCWQPAVTLELRTPIIKPGVYHQSWYLCTAIQTNCYSMVHCSRCTSQNHQSISDNEHSEVRVPRGCPRVTHGPGVPQLRALSNQTCWVSAFRPAPKVFLFLDV